MASSMSHHFRRQVNNNINDPDYCPWWYCDQTAYIIKWIVVGVLFFVIFGFLIGGHYHARKRMAKGLPPLRYHRWLVSRQARERFGQHGRPQQTYGVYRPAYGPGSQGQRSYPMNNYGYAPPPPAYHESEPVPVYTPPSKVNPDQSYGAPQGPLPPAGYNPQAGSSNLNAPAPPPRAASPFNNNSNR